MGTADTNLVQVPVDGDATVTGHVFLDSDASGSQDPGEPDLAGVSVRVTDSDGVTQIVFTDANGDYRVVVPAGDTDLEVDESDPDMPQGAILTTANNPQLNLVAVSGSTVASGDVGYDLPPLTIIKSSNAGGTALVGQTLTYTIAVTNNTGTPQTGITFTDNVPTGTTYVDGTAELSLTQQALRVTEYYVPNGSYTGVDYVLTLDQDLSADYFAIVQGGAGSGGSNGDRGPDDTYVAIVGDGYGTGDLGTAHPGGGTLGLDEVHLHRYDTDSNWVGVVTVVECLAACDTAGFRLLDVQRVDHPNADLSGTDASAVNWTSLSQVMLLGGPNGAGCDTGDATANDHKNCHVRLTPSGSNQIDWSRDDGASSSMDDATSTVMILEWGSEWTVQWDEITNGNSGGGGVDATNEYNPGDNGISAVNRANTWVWGTGHTDDSGIGEAMEGAVIALGDGVNQNATETSIAVGINYANLDLEFDVYALTHPGLSVDHVFRPSGGTAAELTASVVMPTAATGGQRFAFVTNSVESTSNNYPQPNFSARYTGASTVQLERRRYNAAYAAWVQGLDFSGVTNTLTVDLRRHPRHVQPAHRDELRHHHPRPRLHPGARGNAHRDLPGPGDGGHPGQPAEWSTPRCREQHPERGPVHRRRDGRPGVPAGGGGAEQRGVRDCGDTDHVHSHGAERGDRERLLLAERGERAGLGDRSHRPGHRGGDRERHERRRDLGRGRAEHRDPRSGDVRGVRASGVGAGGAVARGSASGGDAGHGGPDRGLEPGSSLLRHAEDEITVLDPAKFGEVIVTPDNSGIVRAGVDIAYSHVVINNTALRGHLRPAGVLEPAPGRRASCHPECTVPIYWDTNGDGIYTPGTDIQIHEHRPASAGGLAADLRGGRRAGRGHAPETWTSPT